MHTHTHTHTQVLICCKYFTPLFLHYLLFNYFLSFKEFNGNFHIFDWIIRTFSLPKPPPKRSVSIMSLCSILAAGFFLGKVELVFLSSVGKCFIFLSNKSQGDREKPWGKIQISPQRIINTSQLTQQVIFYFWSWQGVDGVLTPRSGTVFFCVKIREGGLVWVFIVTFARYIVFLFGMCNQTKTPLVLRQVQWQVHGAREREISSATDDGQARARGGRLTHHSQPSPTYTILPSHQQRPRWI